MKEIKKDCKFYKNNTASGGCAALKRLYCSLENKPCSFYKKRTENDEQELKETCVK